MAKKKQPDDSPSPDLPKFEFIGKATILHLNIRKEGPDDDKALAVDVKLSGKTNGLLLCAYFDTGLFNFLFDADGITRNLMLEPVAFSNVIEDAELVIAGIDFGGAKLSKFRLGPSSDSGMVTITFSASITPNTDEVATLSEYFADDVDVTARMRTGLFDGQGAH